MGVVKPIFHRSYNRENHVPQAHNLPEKWRWEEPALRKTFWGRGLAVCTGGLWLPGNTPSTLRFTVGCSTSPNALSLPLFITHPTAFQLNSLLVPNVQCSGERGKLGSHTWFAFSTAKGSGAVFSSAKLASGRPSKNGSRQGKVIKALNDNTAFSLKSQSINFIKVWSAVPPSNVGGPRGPGLFMNEPPLSCHAEIHSYQPKISNPPAASLKQNTRASELCPPRTGTQPVTSIPFLGPLKSLCQKSSSAKRSPGPCPWVWLQCSQSPILQAMQLQHTFLRQPQGVYIMLVAYLALAVFPLIIFFLGLVA